MNLTRLRRIAKKSFFKTLEVSYPFQHPANKVPNAIMIRYDGCPQIKVQVLEDGQLHVIQLYSPYFLPTKQFGISEGSIISYDELCVLIRTAIQIENYVKENRSYRCKPVNPDYIVSPLGAKQNVILTP